MLFARIKQVGDCEQILFPFKTILIVIIFTLLRFSVLKFKYSLLYFAFSFAGSIPLFSAFVFLFLIWLNLNLKLRLSAIDYSGVLETSKRIIFACFSSTDE